MPSGFEHWLLKFDGMGVDTELGMSQDYGRIEYAYHLMAKSAGNLLAVAYRFGVGSAKNVITQVRHAITGWHVFAKASGVSKAQTAAIGKQLLLLK